MSALSSKHQFKLHNGKRSFSTYSNFPEHEVRAVSGHKWQRVVFLLHGFPDNNTSFEKIFPIIEEKFGKDKVLILAPLLRGYEASSQGPDNEYSVVDLADDVKNWIEEIVPVDFPVHLVGHDWGAIVGFKVASLYPHSITSLVALAIPYITNIRIWEFLVKIPGQLYNSSYMLTMQHPWLYREKFSQTDQHSYLDGLWQYWSPSWNYASEDIDSVRETLKQPGVLDGATAYYRCLFRLLNLGGRRWPVDFSLVPTLILGGAEDGCMGKQVYDLEAEKLANVPQVKVQTVSGLGHFLHREDPVKVGELIADWLHTYK